MIKRRFNRREFLGRSTSAAALAVASAPGILNPQEQSAFPVTVDGDDSRVPKGTAECPPAGVQKNGNAYKPRYAGARWQIRFGSYRGVDEFSVNELQKMVQQFLPYVLEVGATDEPPDRDAHVILLGTAQSNPRIAELAKSGRVTIPTKPEGYACSCFPSPWNHDRKCVVIAGADSSGTLYGVMHFNKRLAGLMPEDPKGRRQALDQLDEFNVAESPAIENRGIWSWGYVVYDYRRFINNMARLRMNRLLLWNDVPALNCRAVIDHAHARGVKVVLGFPWGWGMENIDPNSAADGQRIKDDVLCRVEQMQGSLSMDAIYFQTFTETSKKEIGGKPLAALARDWVNDIAGAILTRYPALRIEWGLHATSILENYKYLESLDPRVVIVWEDAGVIPYAYDPVTHSHAESVPAALDNPQATVDYSQKLSTFRSNREFAMVAKGWTTLNWHTEFEHHGPFILGERAPDFTRDRLRSRQTRWDDVNRLWLKNYPEALRFYRGMLATSPLRMTVLGLIEDGLFEEKIQISAALFAETIWNPHRSDKEILDNTLNPYYSRAF